MPKDIDPMPPRTFRGGFFLSKLIPIPQKLQYRRARRTADFPFPYEFKRMLHIMMDAFPAQYVCPLIKKIARRTNRRATFIVSFFNQFLYLPFSSAFLILAASSAASASRRASRLLSRYSKSSLLPTTSEL